MQVENYCSRLTFPILLQFHCISFMSIISSLGVFESNQLQIMSSVSNCSLNNYFVPDTVVNSGGIKMSKNFNCPEELIVYLKEKLRV